MGAWDSHRTAMKKNGFGLNVSAPLLHAESQSLFFYDLGSSTV